jgi:predicted metal-binding membrane protein
MIPSLEDAIRRDRLVGMLSLAALTALAWVSLIRIGASAALSMDTRVWGAADWLDLFVMWTVMMIGMMLPSVAPVLLHVLQLFRRRGDRLARASGAAFVGGHLLAWTGFSVLAAAAQLLLHRRALLGSSMASESMVLTGVILLAAGVYQCLPVKTACLTYCRPPMHFLSMKRRDGTQGAFVMGLQHGGFCVACCIALMALLFVFGVMNLFWMAALSALVLIEKMAPPRAHVEYASGIPLIVWGVTRLI